VKVLEIEQYLRECGIKVTKGRVNILDILCTKNTVINAECIFEECKKRGINVDLSTVYRSLELFEAKDIIRKFDLGRGKYNYMLKQEDHKHILECKLCHKEVEIDCPMQQIKELIKDKTGFVFVDDELDIKLEGICEECGKKE
jgi:Fe2+ or Zn2+ uptake regulation protein